MESNLYKAALQGEVSCLVTLLNEDALILDRIIAGPYRETPLHIASMLGHLEFVRGILIRKPMLTSELDSHGASHLQLASAKRYVDIVKELLPIEPGMYFVRDKYRRNPLHFAAARGRVDVLKELFQQRPRAAFDKLENNDTIMHLCVENYRLETLKILIMYVDSNNELINSKNDDGNTILHVAALHKQTVTMDFLISETAIEVDATNRDGLTAFNLLAQSEIPSRGTERTNHLNAPRDKNPAELALLANETIEPSETKSSVKESQMCFKWEDDWLERK